MVTLVRDSNDPYQAKTALTQLERVALLERPFPAAWRNKTRNDVAPEFLSYAAPLLGPISHHQCLNRNMTVEKML